MINTWKKSAGEKFKIGYKIGLVTEELCNQYYIPAPLCNFFPNALMSMEFRRVLGDKKTRLN